MGRNFNNIEPVICKNKEGNYEKGNQSEHFAINNMFVLGCHEAGMSPVDADIICLSLSLPLQIGYWSRKGRFKNLEQRVGDAEVVATEKSMREAMNEEVCLTLDVQSPAAKKCKHCGHTDHLRRTSARCQYNNSKMLAAPRVELVHETTGNTDFTDESNTCGSSVAGVI